MGQNCKNQSDSITPDPAKGLELLVPLVEEVVEAVVLVDVELDVEVLALKESTCIGQAKHSVNFVVFTKL